MSDSLALDEFGTMYQPLSEDSIVKSLYENMQRLELQISAFIMNEDKVRKELLDYQREFKVAERKHINIMHAPGGQILPDIGLQKAELETNINDITESMNKTIYWALLKQDTAYGICQGLVEVDSSIQTLTYLFKDFSYTFTGLNEKIKGSDHPLDPKKYLYQFTKSFIESNHEKINHIHALRWIDESKKLLESLLQVPATTVRSVTGYHKYDGVWAYHDSGTRTVHERKQAYFNDYIAKLSEPSDLKIGCRKLRTEAEPVDIARMLVNIQSNLDIHLKNFAMYVHNCVCIMPELDTTIKFFDAGKQKEEYKLCNILAPFIKLINGWIVTLLHCINTLLTQQFLFHTLTKDLAFMSLQTHKAGYFLVEKDLLGF